MVLFGQIIPMISDLIGIIITYLPRIVFSIIAVALGWIIGLFVSFFVRSIVGRMGLETLFRKISVGRAILRTGYTPSTFFATLAKGVIYLFSILFALELLSIPLLTNTVESIMSFIPNLVGGVLILIVGFTFVDWLGNTIEKGSLSTVQSKLLGNIIRMILYFVVVTIALAQIEIDVTVIYIFATALSWSLAIAIGVALGWNLKDKFSLWLEKMSHDDNNEDRL